MAQTLQLAMKQRVSVFGFARSTAGGKVVFGRCSGSALVPRYLLYSAGTIGSIIGGIGTLTVYVP